MSHVKTSSGFEAVIDEARLDDYRLMKAIREAQVSPVAVVDVVSFVLGEDEDRLVAHIEAQTGKVSIEEINKEIGEIFAQLSERKKK